jgi:hypothetical protein
MYNDNDDFENLFDGEELDPVDKAKLDEQYQAELENSMRFAYQQISELGIVDWARMVNFPEEKKLRILTNMMEWYASPDREEYEKAAVLKRGIDTLKLK